MVNALNNFRLRKSEKVLNYNDVKVNINVLRSFNHFGFVNSKQVMLLITGQKD